MKNEKTKQKRHSKPQSKPKKHSSPEKTKEQGFVIKKHKDKSAFPLLLKDEDNSINQGQSEMAIAKHWEGQKIIETVNTAGQILYLEDEQVILSISNGSLLALEPNTLKILKTFSVANEEIVSFAFNKKKKEIICQMSISMIRIFDYDRVALCNSFKLPKTIGKIIQIDLSWHFIAVVTSNNAIMIYDASNFNLECSLTGHTGIIYDIAFNPISEKFLLYSCSEDGSVKIWNLLLKKCVKSLELHTSSVRHIQLTNDGNFLMAGTLDNHIFIWRLKNSFVDNKEDKPKVYKIDQTFESMLYYTKSIHKENRPTLLLGCENGTIVEFDLNEGKIGQAKETGASQPIVQLYYSSQIKRLFLLSSEQFLLFFDVNVVSQDIAHSVCSKVYPCFCQELLSIKFLSEAMPHFVFSSNDPLLKFYDTSKSNVLVFEGHTDFIMNITVKHNYIVTSSKDNTIRVWKWLYDLDDDGESRFTCRCIGLLKGHSETVNFTDIILKKEKKIVSGSKDGSVKLWDIQAIIDQDDDANEEVIISESLYSQAAHSDEVNVVKYSPNEKLIATGSYDKTIHVFNSKLALLSTITGHKRGITDISFSPFAKLLVSSSTDKSIKIWNLTDYSCLNTFEGHLSSVLKVDWVYHGTHLLSSGADGLIKFWNIKTSECINTVDGHEGKIWALDINQSSEEATMTFITGGTDSKIILWKDVTAAKEEELLLQQEDQLNKEEDLRLLNVQGDYIEALKLSLELNHKNNFFTSFQRLVDSVRNKNFGINTSDPIEIVINNRKVANKEVDDHQALQGSERDSLQEVFNNQGIRSLIKGNLGKIIEIIRDYNLKLSTYFYAQVLLKFVLIVTKTEVFIDNGSHSGFRFKEKTKTDQEEDEKEERVFQGKKRQRSLPKNYIDNLQVIKQYSDKHVDRLKREITKSYMIDYSLEAMKLI